MIRVCHIVSGDLWAGAEAVVLNLVKGHVHRPDMDITVLLLNEGKLAENLRALGIRTEVIEESRMPFPRIVRGARAVLECVSPDIIHSHRYKENLIAFLLSGRGRAVKLIATQHGMPEPAGGRIKPKSRLTSEFNFFLLSRRFDRIVVVSRDIQDYFVGRRGFPGAKVKCIHNGIEVPVAGASNGKERPFVIGSSGRFFPVKDYPLMVEIGKRVLERSGRIRFALAGEGPEKRNILDRIRKHGIEEAFALPGFVHDMPSFYRGIDLYLNTSLHEGIPMSILEAMAHGVPVVAPRVGGMPEIIDNGVQGYLVEGRDPGVFAEKCLELLRDRALREQMSSAAREKIRKEFSVAHMAERYRGLYAEAAGSP